MNLQKFRYIPVLAALLCVLFCIAPNASAAESTEDIQQLLQVYPLQPYPYQYSDGNGSMYYSHALLFQGSHTQTSPSPDLTKSSIALSVRAYDNDSGGEKIAELLTSMGFSIPNDNRSSYTRSKSGLALDDCNYVAYTIGVASFTHPATQDSYKIYCVPIQGTPTNLEWFSDFDLGTGETHRGFSNASYEIYNDLKALFAEDGVDAEHRILWLTGHSRGAACANLIAGWFSEDGYVDVARQNLFAYTFACPAVSLNADTTLPNIYNFNNPGDMVPMLPLEDWDYHRYGQTFLLDNSRLSFENVKRRFAAVTGDVYAGEETGDHYKTLLTNTLGTSRDIYNNTASLQLAIDLVAWVLGGQPVPVEDILARHVSNVSKIREELDDITSLETLNALLNGRNLEHQELMLWAHKAFTDTYGMSEEDFFAYLQQNSEMVKQLEKASGVTIQRPLNFQLAESELDKDSYNLILTMEAIDAAKMILFDEDGFTVDRIMHAHIQSTYHIWINSMYYGHEGWYKNYDLTEISIDESFFSIGEGCFFNCTKVSELVVPDTVTTVGKESFAHCYGIKTLTMPIDLSLAPGAFYNTYKIESLCFTKGRTGIMPEYQKNAEPFISHPAYHSDSNIRTIEFGSGITHIGPLYLGYELESVILSDSLVSVGDFAFRNCSQLTINGLPDSLTTIGEAAFYSCEKLLINNWPQKLSSIGPWAFGYCESLTSVPASLSAYPEACFFYCKSLNNLSILNPSASISEEAFARCDMLDSLTIPVDMTYPISAFGYTSFKNICFTKGKTGIMSEIYSDSWDSLTTRYELEHIRFEEGITQIAPFICYDNTSLKTVHFPSTLKTIGGSAFSGCTNLNISSWPENLVTIESGAFYDCKSLTQLTLSDTVTDIGSNAFGNCEKLSRLIIPDSVSYIDAFANCTGIRYLSMPADHDSHYTAFENVVSVEELHFTKGSSGRMSYLLFGSSQNSPFYLSRASLKRVVIEEGITELGPNLFNLQHPLEDFSSVSITLPASLEWIDTGVFANAHMFTSVQFSGNPPYIYPDAFAGTTTICYYPADNPAWTSDVLQNYGGTLTWLPIPCTEEHTYGVPSFRWTEQSYCDAVVFCSICYQEYAVPCNVSSTTVPATQTQSGSITYTASISLDGQTYTDTMVVTIAPGGHVPDGCWYFDQICHWHVCSDCGMIFDTSEHLPGQEASENTSQRCTVCDRVLRTPLGLEWMMDSINDPSSYLWASGYSAKIMEQYGDYLGNMPQ